MKKIKKNAKAIMMTIAMMEQLGLEVISFGILTSSRGTQSSQT